MPRYQIWNRTDDVITPSGAQFTAQDWAKRYPWAKLPGVKMIITASMTDEETLAAIFRAGAESRAVLLDETGECAIPWEVLDKRGLLLYCGVYGTRDEHSVQTLPWTMWGWYCAGVGNNTHIGFEICEDSPTFWRTPRHWASPTAPAPVTW